MMDSMMKKGKSMCDSMMSDMGGMDDMMAKGKSMCDDMMGSSNSSSCSSSSSSSSCSSSNESSSCSTSKDAAPKKDDECCNDGSCEL